MYFPTRLIVVAVATTLFLFACKKTVQKGSGNIKDDIATFHNTKNRVAKYFQETMPANESDETEHAESMLTWISSQPGVAKVTMPDTYVYDITHENGLSGNMLFIRKQTDSRLVTRGGRGVTRRMPLEGDNGDRNNKDCSPESIRIAPMNGQRATRTVGAAASLGTTAASGTMKAFGLTGTTDEEKLLENKNALIIVSYASQFYAPYGSPECKHLGDLIAIFDNSSIDFKVTTKVNEGIAAFTDLDDYGIIIFNTHGTPTGVMTGQHYLEDDLVAFDENITVSDAAIDHAAQLRNGDIKLSSIWEYSSNNQLQLKDASFELTFAFFKSLPVKLDNSVLIGNYCYSGIQNGIMGDMLEPKGLKSFYAYGYHNGWSLPITNDLAWRAEDTIVTNLINEYDTTGIAHLANNTTPLLDNVGWEDMEQFKKNKLAKKFITTPIPLRQFLDKGYHYPKCGDTLIDKRDGKKYATACIGEQVWMGQNLAWAGAGICYNNSTTSCDTYGRLYTIKEVVNGQKSTENPSGIKGICPEGWHVPSKAEWEQLINFVGGEEKANTILRTKTGWPTPNSNTDNFKMSLQPGGLAVNGRSGLVYQLQGQGGYYWTTTPSSTLYFGLNTYPPQMTMFAYGPDTSLDYRFSCRCVKDK